MSLCVCSLPSAHIQPLSPAEDGDALTLTGAAGCGVAANLPQLNDAREFGPKKNDP